MEHRVPRGGQFADRKVGLGANREGSDPGGDRPPPFPTCPLGLGLGLLLFLGKLEEPRVGLIGHFRKDQQVVAPKALRALPLIAVFVEAREGDVVPRLLFGSIAPNRSLDATDPDFINGFLV